MNNKTFGIMVLVLAVLIFAVNRYAVQAIGSGRSGVTISGVTTFGVNKPTCECKFGAFSDCIRNTIENRKALIEGYHKLASKWAKFWTNTDSGKRVEMVEIDWGKMNAESKKTTVETLLDELEQYAKDEEEMTHQIDPIKGCGYEFYSGTLAMKTDLLTCEIKMNLAKNVEEAVPCKDLYTAAMRHEVMHHDKCEARLRDKKLLTPMGLALEEASGYKQEIAELERLLPQNDNCSKGSRKSR
jgi:hypothetical protein